MKKFFDIRIIAIIMLVIVLGIMITIYINYQNESQTVPNMSSRTLNDNFNTSNENESSATNKVLQTTSEIISGLSENIELHATYYLAECYVQANQEVKKGENILKYTNGTFLVAPYDCVIIKLNIPSNSGKCTNEHYVSISSVNVLAVQFKVDESKISDISVGKSALIKVSALEEKEFNGYVTKISSTANNGSFTVTAEFENDSDVKIGMTATVEL